MLICRTTGIMGLVISIRWIDMTVIILFRILIKFDNNQDMGDYNWALQFYAYATSQENLGMAKQCSPHKAKTKVINMHLEGRPG